MSPTAARSLEQQVEVETPEQVVFSYTVAGIGSRAAAALIDVALCGVAMLLLVILVAIAQSAVGWRMNVGAGWMFAIFIVAQFAILWGYNVLFEGLADGQTPGKRRLGLRVVQDGGYSVSFAASAVRNLVRVIDMQPGIAYGVGMVSAALSDSGKRLGDYAAGTFVVREEVIREAIVARPSSAAGGDAGGKGSALPIATQLTDEEFTLLERYVARRQALEPARRQQLAAQLAQRFRPRAPDVGGSDGAALLQIFERERDARARGVAARSDTGARREQHAIVARGSARWAAFAALLADAQRRGLRRMSEEEVSEFVAQYRELSTDLARLRTATRGRDSNALFALSRLVGGGHNLLYRQRPLTFDAAVRYLFRTAPREIRRSALPIGLAALRLFGPAVVTYAVVVRDPAVAAEFLPAEMIDRAETGKARERRGEAYLPREMARMRGPFMGSLLHATLPS